MRKIENITKLAPKQLQIKYICKQELQVMEDIKSRIKLITDEINRHNYQYYVLSNPTISDFEFDKLLVELQELEKLYP